MNYPLLMGFCLLLVLWAAALAGALCRKRRRRAQDDHEWDEFGLVVSATLTLLGLLIGFSFSMAIGRYDQRKNYEEEEANAIGTEYVRADLLPDPTRSKVKGLLVEYLNLRIRLYESNASDDTAALAAKTAQLQDEMWNAVAQAAATNPTPLMAAVVIGMNDVLNRQGYTQAARLNRIPVPAWFLMIAIAIFSNFLIGYGVKNPRSIMFLVLPMTIAVSFFLVADIDSPQGGIIRVAPQNLIVLSDSMKPGS
jgi:hypothetical protein